MTTPYLLQLQANSGWTSILRDLTEEQADFLRDLSDAFFRASGSYGAEMEIRPVSEADPDDVEAAWRPS